MTVHRVRVPHGKGEINLVVEVVDGPVARDPFAEDEATSIHAPLSPLRSRVSEAVAAAGSVNATTGAASELVLAPGGKVGKYELEQKLGQGTFGVVFTARDTDLDRKVAIKILNPSHQTNGEIVHRFLQEARASARIAHPGIVMVLDCGRVGTHIGETAYIVLELLGGESLTNRLARSARFAPPTAIEVTRQIASALEAAHRADVLHRDLKPDNIYLVPDAAIPAGERVKVLDFGLAKIGTSRHTTVNTIFGTPRYMSPEQTRSAANIDHRADIYSLGCILFELVTGRTPFEGDLRHLIECHQRQTAPRARELAPEIPPQLDDLIAQMLAKDPNTRPQTMGAVQAALYAHGAVAPGVAATMMPTPAQAMMVAALSSSNVDARIAPTQMPQHLPQLPQPMVPQPMPPQIPQMVPPRERGPHESGVMIVPPSGIHPKRLRHGTATLPKKRGRKLPIAAAAIAFFIAAALTALVARGNTQSANAETPPAPLPTPPPAPTVTPAPADKLAAPAHSEREISPKSRSVPDDQTMTGARPHAHRASATDRW